MHDILTVTLNPTVDLSTSVAHVVPGDKLRCAPPVTDPGGGGINVSRAIRLLGGESRALVALGGHNGDKLRALLEHEGIRLIPLVAPGETRMSLAVTDSTSGEQFRFVLPGPIWNEAGLKATLAAVTTAVPEAGYVVISGSLPRGLPEDFTERVCAKIGSRGARVLADTSGPALTRLAEARDAVPYVLRMDGLEAEELAGRALPDRKDSADFASELVARGVASIVVIARGAEGNVLAAEGLRLHVAAAKVPVRSLVGAGDSFVGAFVLALARGAELARALQWGAAAASAAVMTDATALCTREDTEALLDRCPVTEI
ncbi:1-phosphofructokinase family hexose kinase [Rhodovulum sp. BSW8]|uniref:Phosphofructokinase n=1 Tax=Rhodovulum visakhapatnamense TaxID=364297 RepID=A0A4R8FNR4_9RHOB|nr:MULTISPECIES: 1-phosphofructokinase family hexose kinase [Rhodovulum]RBO51998.1 1-phosphofructokinase family hexose kinase [Rhodovulum sp. BSW8]TDX28004.1 6-phosphofructokinase 2 [Rhodovulum visakhapatnamense]